MVADRIRKLREKEGLTQSQLAKRLGLTRSCVNAWEMGISVPSTQGIVELAAIFNISTDYLLGVDRTATISIEGLKEDDVQLVHSLICHLKQKNLGVEL